MAQPQVFGVLQMKTKFFEMSKRHVANLGTVCHGFVADDLAFPQGILVVPVEYILDFFVYFAHEHSIKHSLCNLERFISKNSDVKVFNLKKIEGKILLRRNQAAVHGESEDKFRKTTLLDTLTPMPTSKKFNMQRRYYPVPGSLTQALANMHLKLGPLGLLSFAIADLSEKGFTVEELIPLSNKRDKQPKKLMGYIDELLGFGYLSTSGQK